MKNNTLARVFSLQKKATELAREFIDILKKEKAALIALKTDEIMSLTSEKEHSLSLVKKLREELHTDLKTYYGIESSEFLETLLVGEEKKEWLLLRNEWLKVWQESVAQMEANQKFMNHSLKNISCLFENLKGLFGQKPIYSSKGQKVEAKIRTRVIEGRY